MTQGDAKLEKLSSYQYTTPEQGQLVTVRQRRYVVTKVQQSSLLPSPLALSPEIPQHLVSLRSVEDDALGESLEVIWELEPGTRIEELVGLPQVTGFDPPERLDAFLDAVRWGAVSSADMRTLQAPFRSGIEIEDYQLDPLVRAIQMPRVNLLVADDVGLGKTIEAGLVIQELIVRARIRSVLVVCPAGLQIHWRDQMRDKFGLEFRIVDSSFLKELRRRRGIHTNPWTHFPRLITSIDYIKRDRPMRLMREVLPAEGETVYPQPFDVLIVDEAHNVAPSGVGEYAIDSLRTQAVRTLVPHFEHRLFLTATPHNGYPNSFTALLEMLDNQRFARGVTPNPNQLEAIMVRRLKSEFVNWDGKNRFKQRILDVIEVDYREEERQVHRWLREYTELRHKSAKSNQARYATEFVLKLLKKRLFSSPAAFALTLEKHVGTLRKGVAKQSKSKKSISPGILRRRIAQIDEDYAIDDEYENAIDDAVDTASNLFDRLSPREKKLLDQMQSWADRATHQVDQKTAAFLAWLCETVKPSGQWNDERVIVFTEYRATQNWLQGLLASAGLGSDERLMTLYGGMDTERREEIKAAFQARPDQSPVRILLATDSASEGIDLQNYCHRLVHFEIPWNPNRMEQRNGRVDRHGQQHDVLIYHFAGKGYKDRLELDTVPVGELEGDLEFLMRATRKVQQIREDLGKVGPVIASQVEEAMLGKRDRLDTQLAEDDAQAGRRMLKFERDLKAMIAQHYQLLQETRQNMKLSHESVEKVVAVALDLAEQPALVPATGGDILEGQAYHLPPLNGSWAASAYGLEHPHTREVRPIVFDHAAAKGRDDVVLAHLNHRLVQMSLRLLRAEVWSSTGQQGLFRVTARQVPDYALTTPAVIAHARLVITGGDSQRLHEQIITAGGFIKEGRFRRIRNVGERRNLLDTATNKPVSSQMQQKMIELWPQLEDSLIRSLEVRRDERLSGMQTLLEERAAKESTNIRAVLTELETNINAELKRLNKPEQLELFSNFKQDEREQIDRNKAALHVRLRQIPEEIKKEVALISQRYADPQPRMFPVAVTFLVPEKFS